MSFFQLVIFFCGWKSELNVLLGVLCIVND